MAWTTTQLAAIEQAIASGELEVSFDGRTVKYRSMDELCRVRDMIRSDLIASGQLAETAAPRRSYAVFDRGA